MIKMVSHNNLIKLIEDYLNKKGYITKRNVEYHLGEIDLYGIKGSRYILLFEMKTHDSSSQRKKAYKQLNKAERHYFPPYFRVFKFYVYYDKNNEVKIEWYRSKKKYH